MYNMAHPIAFSAITTNIRMMSYDHHLRRREENQRSTELCSM